MKLKSMPPLYPVLINGKRVDIKFDNFKHPKEVDCNDNQFDSTKITQEYNKLIKQK